MAMLPKTRPIHGKGQADHVDAWLMSYADLITLLFMFFVIFVSFTYAQSSDSRLPTHGEPEHPYIEEHFDRLSVNTPFERTYASMQGIVLSAKADQSIAVSKTHYGLSIDIAASLFFDTGTAEIRSSEQPVLTLIADALKEAPADASIEVAAYTDDQQLKASQYATSWELSAMQAAHIVSFLIEKGVDPARLRAVNYASAHPVVPNNDSKGEPIAKNRLRNQRVVINVEKKFPRETSLSFHMR